MNCSAQSGIYKNPTSPQIWFRLYNWYSPVALLNFDVLRTLMDIYLYYSEPQYSLHALILYKFNNNKLTLN